MTVTLGNIRPTAPRWANQPGPRHCLVSCAGEIRNAGRARRSVLGRRRRRRASRPAPANSRRATAPSPASLAAATIDVWLLQSRIAIIELRARPRTCSKKQEAGSREQGTGDGLHRQCRQRLGPCGLAGPFWPLLAGILESSYEYGVESIHTPYIHTYTCVIRRVQALLKPIFTCQKT